MQGAMVYVVVDDIVPEAQSQGNGRAASWGAVVVFFGSNFTQDLKLKIKRAKKYTNPHPRSELANCIAVALRYFRKRIPGLGPHKFRSSSASRNKSSQPHHTECPENKRKSN